MTDLRHSGFIGHFGAAPVTITIKKTSKEVRYTIEEVIDRSRQISSLLQLANEKEPQDSASQVGHMATRILLGRNGYNIEEDQHGYDVFKLHITQEQKTHNIVGRNRHRQLQ